MTEFLENKGLNIGETGAEKTNMEIVHALLTI